MTKTKNLSALITIIFIGAICYGSAVNNSFVWDDKGFVVLNPAVRSLNNIVSFFTDPKTAAEGALAKDVYRPFMVLSFAIDYHFFKLSPSPYHIENVIFHIINAVLLYFLLQLILKKQMLALIASLIFLTHPAQTEAVTWISGRGNALFVFFFLITLLLYVRFRKTEKIGLFALSICAFILSVFSKEMAVTLPFVIASYEYFFGDARIDKRVLKSLVPYFLVVAAYLILRFNLMHEMGQRIWWGGSLYRTALTMSKALIYYIKVSLFPYALCADPVMLVSRSIMEPVVFKSIIILAAIFILLAILAKRAKTISFGITWFFVTLLPVMNFIPINALVAERFLYLPIIGFAIIAASVLSAAYRYISAKFSIRHANVVITFLAAVLISLYAVRTYVRNSDWKDEDVFFHILVKSSPYSSNAHYNLGNVYFDQGKYDLAINEYLVSLKLKPKYSFTHLMLGSAYEKVGELDKAMVQYQETLALDPDNIVAHNLLGAAYFDRGRYDDALEQYQKAIALNKNYVLAYVNIGNVYFKLGKTEDCKKAWKRALKLDPSLRYLDNNLRLLEKDI